MSLQKKLSLKVDIHNKQILQRHFRVKVSDSFYFLLRFNVSVARSAQLAFFGRRNVAPSITQYDFVKFISSGRRGRMKREPFTVSLGFEMFGNAKFAASLNVMRKCRPDKKKYNIYIYFFLPQSDKFFNHHLNDDFNHGALLHVTKRVARWHEVISIYLPPKSSSEEVIARPKRFVERRINVTVVEYLDTGKWYLSVYNDGLGTNEVTS